MMATLSTAYSIADRGWFVRCGLRGIYAEVFSQSKGAAINAATSRWRWLLETMATDPAWRISR